MRIVPVLCLPLWCTAAQVSAQVAITHDALTCMSTQEFPVVEAELDPAELRGVRKAHVYFKASRTDAWYFVEMEPGEKATLRAMLPKPLGETRRVDYYVFVLTGTFEPSQTEEYSAHVSESGCGAAPAVAAGSPASLTLHATVANQAPVPPGFQPGGISGLVTTTGNTVAVGSAAAGGGAASGGVSGMTLGLVAGGAAAATGVAVTSGSDEGGDGGAAASPDAGSSPGGDVTQSSPTPSPAPSPTPSPEPSPTPSVPDVSGTWLLSDRLTESCDPSLVGRTSRTAMTIQQSGTALNASRVNPDGSFREDLSGTIDTAGNLSMRGPFTDEGETGESQWNASTTSGDEMSGRYSRFYPAHDCTLRWTFTGTKQ